MSDLNKLVAHTNAGEPDVVRAFRAAFFTSPTFGDHFKPTPIAHFRAQMTWRATEVLDSVAAARLDRINLNRSYEDLKGWRHEVGETIAVAYEPADDGQATVTIWTDSEPMTAGIDTTNPIVLHTYAYELFSQLKQAGFTVDREGAAPAYHEPPGAPPGWPFPA
jgi:hypothetical protein